MHYFYFIVVALVWGSGFYLMKLAGFAFGPLTVGAISTFGGAVFLWIVWALNRQKWQISKEQWIPLILISIFAFTFPYAAQPFLVNLIGHGFIGMMVSIVPLLTILVSIPLLKTMPSKVQFAGVLIGMAGIILMLIDGFDRNVEPIFLLMAVSVPFCYATTNTLIRRDFQRFPPIVLTALLMSSGTLFLTPFAVIFEEIVIDEHFVTAILAIVTLSVFARGLAMFLFYQLIQSKGPLFAGLVTYVIPIEALIWSWFDNEEITKVQIASITIVLLVVGVVQRDIVAKGKK